MNIMLDCERMKYPNTGLNTFCNQLASAMSKTVKKTDNLSFFVSPHDIGFLGEDKKYIKQHPIDKFLGVRSKKLDIWHTTYQLSKYTGGDSNTKKLLTIHDLNYLYEKSTLSDIKRYQKRHQKILDRADHIVAISRYVKDDILNHLNIRGKPISVVYNGYEIEEFPNFDNPSYRPEKPFIATIGTVVRKKNFHILPSLLVGNDYELIIAGTISTYAEEIMYQAKLMNVANRVKLLGAVSPEDKYWYMSRCTAFAFPSIAEGFGLPVLEAMHFGKPVFLSSLTSLPEVGGNSAYYFDEFDPDIMLDVFERGMNDYVTNNRKEAIIRHASSFSWDKCAKEYYDIYKDLL